MARFFKWLFGFSGGIIVFLTQTPPDEAISSLSKWANTVGVDKPPEWLEHQSVDTIGLWVGLGLLVACSLIWIYQRIKKEKSIIESRVSYRSRKSWLGF